MGKMYLSSPGMESSFGHRFGRETKRWVLRFGRKQPLASHLDVKLGTDRTAGPRARHLIEFQCVPAVKARAGKLQHCRCCKKGAELKRGRRRPQPQRATSYTDVCEAKPAGFRAALKSRHNDAPHAAI